jgi:hypothetical protein
VKSKGKTTLPFEGDREQHRSRKRVGETINKPFKGILVNNATTTGNAPAELPYGRNLGSKLWDTAIHTNR